MKNEKDYLIKVASDLKPGDRISSYLGTFLVIDVRKKGSKIHVQVEPRSPEGWIIPFSPNEIVEVEE